MRFFSKFFSSSKDLEFMEKSHGATDPGRMRSENEDFFLIDPQKKLYIAADGMGGHNAGEVASFKATEAVYHYFTDELISEIRGNAAMIKRVMTNCLLSVHREIIEIAKKRRGYQGMGSTIVVAFVDGHNLHLGHVGDARAYIYRNHKTEQLTMDHSYVASLVKLGKLTEEEARKSPMKNKITQAIGVPLKIAPEYTQTKFNQGDKLLLCSDGLWEMLSLEKINKVLGQKKTPKEICEELIRSANKAGGRDNITVVVACR